ncbi:hypothetical protein [Cognatiyoonia sp. IB215182]|uniref:hypothetical protein n=1 Tax=Cognatiyoonia sp. IB215182 TaxID=3097353 RepID=UPI002A135002|nr:hypothetical protein [Cognatiyoonia sp. IB215182]MDX8355803.1 hypothetical protein [Cognatiyoonia sp. IB215182]
MLQPVILSNTTRGRYFWQTVFNLDNSGNNASLKRTIEIERRATLTSKSFLTKAFDTKSIFKFGNKTSASLKFKGVGAENTTEFNMHLELASRLEEKLERTTETYSGYKETHIYEVGPNSKLALYRLHYESDGVVAETEILSTTKSADVFVDLNFTLEKELLGLEEILLVLRDTKPSQDNVAEWTTVRNSIVSSSHKPYDEAFGDLLDTLESITPGRANTAEWAEIRNTCSEIKTSRGTTDDQLLLRKLLTRFSVTIPGQDNKAEWAKIKEESDRLLSGISQIY